MWQTRTCTAVAGRQHIEDLTPGKCCRRFITDEEADCATAGVLKARGSLDTIDDTSSGCTSDAEGQHTSRQSSLQHRRRGRRHHDATWRVRP